MKLLVLNNISTNTVILKYMSYLNLLIILSIEINVYIIE